MHAVGVYVFVCGERCALPPCARLMGEKKANERAALDLGASLASLDHDDHRIDAIMVSAASLYDETRIVHQLN